MSVRHTRSEVKLKRWFTLENDRLVLQGVIISLLQTFGAELHSDEIAAHIAHQPQSFSFMLDSC